MATGDASSVVSSQSSNKRMTTNGKISAGKYVPNSKTSAPSLTYQSGDQVSKNVGLSSEPENRFGTNYNNDLNIKEYYELSSGNQINLRPGRSREKYVEAQIFVKELKDRQTEILPEFSRIPLPHRTNTDSKGDNSYSAKSGYSKSVNNSNKGKFCYECGAHYLSDVAKFCAECGIRRVAL